MTAVSSDGAESGFTVELGAFEGPLDLLLDLARSQRIDLRQISVVTLADQYLVYLGAVRAARLEIAAEYLVMATWLTYLKCELLLPVLERTTPDAEAVAQDLARRMHLLDGLRAGAAWLAERPLLGRQRLARGAREPFAVKVEPCWTASLAGLLASYGIVSARASTPAARWPRRRVLGVDDALRRLSRLLTGFEWRDLRSFHASGGEDELERRGTTCAFLVAGLELARRGSLELQQAVPFAAVMVRRRGAS